MAIEAARPLLIALSLSAVVLIIHSIHLVKSLFRGRVLSRKALDIQTFVLRADVFARRGFSPEDRQFGIMVLFVSIVHIVRHMRSVSQREIWRVLSLD